MRDPALEALLKGAPFDKSILPQKRPKTPFDIALEEEVESYLAEHPPESDPSRLHLLTPEAQRSKLKLELIENAKKQDVTPYIKEAVELVHKQGSQFLDSSENETLQTELDNAAKKVALLDVKQLIQGHFQELLDISNNSMDALFKIGVVFFDVTEYGHSMAIFVLLTTLNANSAEYWFRFALAAQMNDQNDLALRGYNNALTIDHEFIAAEIFCSQCYLTLGRNAEAEVHYQQAQMISKSTEPAPEWLKLLDQIGSNFTKKNN